MNKVSGESTVYSYEQMGGIALYDAAVDPPDGAIVGGSGDSEEGSGAVATRIRWWIAYDGNEYSGGITGISWFRLADGYNLQYTGPFEGVTDQELYEYALSNGNLNKYFNDWNSAHSASGDLTITGFTWFLQTEGNAVGCVSPGGVSG